ncbi:hypothetical protein BgiMline_009316, partial [Biomphalaria glabrata]
MRTNSYPTLHHMCVSVCEYFRREWDNTFYLNSGMSMTAALPVSAYVCLPLKNYHNKQ